MIRSAFSLVLSLVIGISIFGFFAMALLQLGLGKEAVAHRYNFAPWLRTTLGFLGLSAVVGGVLSQFFAKRSSRVAQGLERTGLVIFALCFATVIFLVTISYFTGLGRVT
ncbi:hypothetical protein [Cognatiyoonia sp. IB215182]|uniref:hypothetical protein n=1 Tax=Cognatiyoonia sp. IB215182 TaxID=3097353 RepID=UPI002A1524C4|nr:hypothetical protein [Cognatiyoonia sp. IB215182]MDX8352587.1 hypothetical protein [Cognatiyoonia sp. IB215182]